MEFEIQYEGRTCRITKIDHQSTQIYKVAMVDRTILLTQAKRQGGSLFWTCIPESTGNDQKLAEKLGVLIDQHGKNLLF